MGLPSPIAGRFWSKVDLSNPDGCWPWKGSYRHAYGEVWRDGKRVYAHRAGYELVHGPILDGLHVCHRCDNPRCVRPDHLFLGTAKDNLDDARAKGRLSPPPLLRGERARTAKLTADDVRAMRALAAGGMAQREIAARFSVSQTAASAAIRRVTWSHVA